MGYKKCFNANLDNRKKLTNQTCMLNHSDPLKVVHRLTQILCQLYHNDPNKVYACSQNHIYL